MNPQEQHWAGAAGDAYQARNADSEVGSVSSNRALFADILTRIQAPKSVIEFGAGVGNNIEALRAFIPDAEILAIEINAVAAKALANRKICEVIPISILNCGDGATFELAFTKGVLIHIAPDDLPRAYHALYTSSSRYILTCEYFSPKPRMIPYHGEKDRLWARDFAGELLDRYPDLRLVDYGFRWRRDRHPQDDITWFLLEKGRPA